MPTYAAAKGILPLLNSMSLLKLMKIPCAVSGLRYPVMYPDGPIWFVNIKLKGVAFERSFPVSGSLIASSFITASI